MTDAQAQKVRAMYVHGGATEEQIAKAMKLPLAAVRWFIDHGTVKRETVTVIESRREAIEPNVGERSTLLDSIVDDLLGGKR